MKNTRRSKEALLLTVSLMRLARAVLDKMKDRLLSLVPP